MKTKRALAVVVAAWVTGVAPGLLAGCQSAPRATHPAATLVLLQALTVPADRAAVEIQAGRAIAGAHIDRYRPYCRFELAQRADTARTLAPGAYRIDRRYETVPAARAARGLLPARWVTASGDASYLVFATVFALAPNAAGLARLTCQHWELPTPNTPRHLTPAEIGHALGAVARIE